MTQFDNGDAPVSVVGDSTTTGTSAGTSPAVDLTPPGSRVPLGRNVLRVTALVAIALAAAGAFLLGSHDSHPAATPTAAGSTPSAGTTVHDPVGTVSGTSAHRRTPIRRVSPHSS